MGQQRTLITCPNTTCIKTSVSQERAHLHQDEDAVTGQAKLIMVVEQNAGTPYSLA